MDAKALLSAQGWRGKGHSLHATDDSIGLARPLMLSRKPNNLGVGNQHFTSDQWWLNAFDEQVKGLDTSKDGRVVQTVTGGKLDTVGKGTGRYALYASFVRGGLLEGSIPKVEAESVSHSSAELGAVTPIEQTEPETETEKRSGETKEERRARRAARRLRKAEKLDRRKSKIQGDAPQGSAEEPKKPMESKEERRARKEARRRCGE